MKQSDLCDYADAYIVVKEFIAAEIRSNDTYDKKNAFINSAPFISCITKINNTLVDNSKYLDIIMRMYNLIEYSKNYSKTSGTLQNYYRDEPNSGLGGANNNIIYSNFKHILENTTYVTD